MMKLYHCKIKIIFLLTVLLVLVSNRGLAWDFDKLKEDASGWVDKKKEETSDYIDRKKEESSDYFQKKKEDAYDWSSKKSREIKEKGEEWSEKASKRIKKESEKVQEKTKSFYEGTKSKAGSYIEKYKPEIQYKAEQARDEFSSFISDSDNQRKVIEKVRGFGRAKQEIEIGLIKSVPVYDPKDGKVKSFDRFMREMVGELGGGSLGGDLAKDPVRTGYLMCVDTDYFLKMNFIPGPEEDQWLSIDDALNAGYKTYDVKEMKEEYNAIKKAYREGDADNLNMHLNYFRRSLNKIQPQRSQSFLVKEKIKTIAQSSAWIVISLVLLLIAGFSIKSFLGSSRAYCERCNYKNDRGSKFCEKCGRYLSYALPFHKRKKLIIWSILLLVVFLMLGITRLQEQMFHKFPKYFREKSAIEGKINVEQIEDDIEEVKTLDAFGYRVDSVAFSPDGKYLASANVGIIQIWDMNTFKEIKNWLGHQFLDGVVSIAFSPDSRYLASGGRDNTVKIWNMNTFEELKTLKGAMSITWFNSVAFSPNGKYLAGGGQNPDTIQIWDKNTFEEIKILRGHTHSIESIDFSPNGKYLASGSIDKTIKIWDMNSFKEVKSLKRRPNRCLGDPAVIAFSCDGRYLASESDETIQIWDMNTFEEIKTLRGHSKLVLSIAFSPDSRYLASGSSDNTVKIWDMDTFKELKTLRGYAEWVSSVAFSPDNRYLASGSRDGTVKIWKLPIGKSPSYNIKIDSSLKTHAKKSKISRKRLDGKTLVAEFVWSKEIGGNGHYYAVFGIYDKSGMLSWDEAKTVADSLDGYLVTITSSKEQRWIVDTLGLEPSHGTWWIGGYQDRQDSDFYEPSGGWKWVTGERWSYTNWLSGEPNNCNAHMQPPEDILDMTSSADGGILLILMKLKIPT